MITRIFRVQVPSELHQEFEEQFIAVSIPYIQKYTGLISVSIGKPIVADSDEYVMVSNWESVTALERFAGKNWNQAVIPPGMDKYVRQCWIHHYEAFGV